MRRLVPGLLLVASLAGCGTPLPQLVTSPLQLPAMDATLMEPGGQAVNVVVTDRRPARELASGFLGPQGERHEGIYFGYVAPGDGEVVQFVEGAAKEALSVLGIPSGSSATLEIVVEDLRIDLHRFHGFSPMNCVAYGRIRTRLLEGGREMGGGVFRVTYFENTTPAMSMKEVSREAISRIWAQATWEAVGRTLVSARSLKPDPARVSALLSRLGTEKSELVRRKLVFWLGLVGQGSAAVAESLETTIRTSQEPRYRQGAVEAAGMLGLSSVKPLLERILVEKVGDWNTADTEQVWYVLKALHALGETDVASRIPKTKLKMGSRLDQLATFLRTGEPPPLVELEMKGLEAARRNVKK